jgi:hypothetical protein
METKEEQYEGGSRGPLLRMVKIPRATPADTGSRRKHGRDRLLCVHPIIKKREELGAFYTLFYELRDDAHKFLNYFRMLVSSFDELHPRFEGSLRRRKTKMRNYIQPVEILAVAIR